MGVRVLRVFWWAHHDLVVAVSKRGSVKCFEGQFTWALGPVMETTRVLASPWYVGDFFFCTELRLVEIAGGAKSHVAATGNHEKCLEFSAAFQAEVSVMHMRCGFVPAVA
jgi:hypothetical protein